MARKRSRKRSRKRKKPEGVASRSELSAAFSEAWEKCGHPRVNPKCWSRILKQTWADV